MYVSILRKISFLYFFSIFYSFSHTYLQFFGVIEVQINKFKSKEKHGVHFKTKTVMWEDLRWFGFRSFALRTFEVPGKLVFVFSLWESLFCSFALGKVMQRYMFRKKVWICFVQVGKTSIFWDAITSGEKYPLAILQWFLPVPSLYGGLSLRH